MRTRILGLVLALGVWVGAPPFAQGGEPPDLEAGAIGRTPPRLSLVHGQVSFWRPGAQDWVQAAVNTPLAPGDRLSTGAPGALELQIGARAFVRGWGNVVLGLEDHEPDFLQFRMTAGRASFDLRSVEAGRTVEVATPNAAFVIEHPGYYRVHVDGERTSLIVRRAGRATVIPASGNSFSVAASEEVVVEGASSPQVSAFVAPALDDWDRWNYARTDALLDAVSARYVSPGTYGVDDLDHHGTWRVVAPYGPVWVPAGVPAGWVPYSTGAWVRDPFYGWTWVDAAPWGWAPYHYGRWVYVNGFWAWAPGPLVARPVYAPALVAFLGGAGVQVRVGIGGPVVGWVALGWGEPCVPWWGRPGFIHRPWWGGWGGPRVVNNVIVERTTVVKVEHIRDYHHAQLRNGVVVVREETFGRGRVAPERVTLEEARRFQPAHAAPRIAESPLHFMPTDRRGVRPSEEQLRRPVVATRPSPRAAEAASASGRAAGSVEAPAPAARLVPAPERREPAQALSRPPFGKSAIERPVPDRPQAPAGQPEDRPRATERPESAKSAIPESVSPPPRPVPQPSSQPPASPHSAPRRETTSPAPVRPESRAAAPAPAAPASPATVTRPSPAPVAPATPIPAARQTPAAPRPEPKAAAAPPTSQQEPPQPRPEAKAAPTPAPAPTRGAVGPPPAASRPEAKRPATRPLPGEPANRLAPDREEGRPQREGGRQEGAPPNRPQAGTGLEPRGRPRT